MTSRVGTGADARRSRTDNSGSTRAESRASASSEQGAQHDQKYCTASARRRRHEAEGARADGSVHVGGIGRRVGADFDQRSASHPEVSCQDPTSRSTPSANLIVDTRLRRGLGQRPAGTGPGSGASQGRPAHRDTNDDSFGQGTKEDTAVPSVVDGGVPPNKSDLIDFGGYLETTRPGIGS